MNEERTVNCLQQIEHIRGDLWHIYYRMVNQVMVVTVTLSLDIHQIKNLH